MTGFAGRVRPIFARDLTGADIGRRIGVRIISGRYKRPFTLSAVLSDVERQNTGARLAHVAIDDDGHLHSGRTTAQSLRIAIYAGGHTLLLDPDHPLLLADEW